jgi:hypothetical protein
MQISLLLIYSYRYPIYSDVPHGALSVDETGLPAYGKSLVAVQSFARISLGIYLSGQHPTRHHLLSTEIPSLLSVTSSALARRRAEACVAVDTQ